MSEVPVVLAIGGSDSSGGAGIQADVRTLTALGVHATTAVTAVTAQGAAGVVRWSAVDPELVRDQVGTTLDDYRPAVVKTGMLATAAIVEIVAERLAAAGVPVVCDPVLVSSSGRRLLEVDAVGVLVERLFPLVSLLTPNAEEAAVLTGRPVRDLADAEEAARELRAQGPRAVLVKGGHLEDGAGTDVLVDGDGARRLPGEWIDTPHRHGTGCVLASAIAAWLARGETLGESVVRSKRFVTEAIRRGRPLAGTPGSVVPPPAGWR